MKNSNYNIKIKTMKTSNLKSLWLLLVVVMAPVLAVAQFSNNGMQFYKPNNQSAINVFETSKLDTVQFDGVKVKLGGAFALQFQALDHENTATPKLNADGVNLNALKELTNTFNTATANMNIDVQLADGIRMELVTYLSSRHHNEAWVKGGYLQIDKLPFLKSAVVDNIMDHVTLRVGHMEINYGDAHFRRTDNGNAFFNPFVGNYIMDAFATEIGGEVYVKFNPFFVMGGVTNGLIKGDAVLPTYTVTNADGSKEVITGSNPSILGKAGFDKQINEDLRVRLTGSIYYNSGTQRNTLYGGDRAGSRYYYVMENTLASATSQFTSGRFNPNLSNRITAFVVNPFIKFHGAELFANYEVAKGGMGSEVEDRTWTQIAVDGLYRFGATENFYIGGRYNTVKGDMIGYTEQPSITRIAGAFGWFITPNVKTKLEYVNQTYDGWKEDNIYNGGKFNGFVIEGAINF